MDVHLILLVALIALQVADIATTHYVLKTGIGTEANPVLNKLFQKFGHEPVLLTTKGAFIVFLLVVQSQLPAWVLGGLGVFYVAIVGNNVNVILRSRKGKFQ